MAQVTGRPVDDRYVRHLALASWRNYGRYAADFMNFSRLDIDFIEQHMRDLSQGGKGWQSLMMLALQAGRGAIVARAHSGNWDMAGAIIARLQPFSHLAGTFMTVSLNQFVEGARM